MNQSDMLNYNCSSPSCRIKLENLQKFYSDSQIYHCEDEDCHFVGLKLMTSEKNIQCFSCQKVVCRTCIKQGSVYFSETTFICLNCKDDEMCEPKYTKCGGIDCPFICKKVFSIQCIKCSTHFCTRCIKMAYNGRLDAFFCRQCSP
jgi:hypothetical protein